MAGGMLGGLTFTELGKRVWKEADEDKIFGTAAELAYYFLLALFPMLIFLTSLVGFLPGAQENILNGLAKAVPGEAMDMVRETLQDVVANRSGGLLSFGVLGTLWASSSGVSSLMESLNIAYEVKEGRSFIKQRVVAVGLTIMLTLLIIGGTVLIMFGDKLADGVAGWLGLGPAFVTVWHIVDYILGLALLFVGIQIIYYFGPNIKQAWSWITPGAAFAVFGLIVGSLAFSLYLRFGPKYSATYGSIGAVIVLMLWLYMMGLMLLTGAEINSEIARAKNQMPAEREQPEQLKAA